MAAFEWPYIFPRKLRCGEQLGAYSVNDEYPFNDCFWVSLNEYRQPLIGDKVLDTVLNLVYNWGECEGRGEGE